MLARLWAARRELREAETALARAAMAYASAGGYTAPAWLWKLQREARRRRRLAQEAVTKLLEQSNP